MTRIYLDRAPVIYTVEQTAPFAARVDARLATPGLVQVASDLTRMECRIHPVRSGDRALLQEFDDYFALTVAEIRELSRAVIDHATEIRARYGFKIPDAIHLAAAVVSACDVFTRATSGSRNSRESRSKSFNRVRHDSARFPARRSRRAADARRRLSVQRRANPRTDAPRRG